MKLPLTAVIAFLTACGAAQPGTGPTSGLTKDDAVFEAVYLHELAGTTVAADEAVCLAIRGATTDGADLLAAIRARYPTAVRDNECMGGGPTGPVTVVATGGAALRLDIGPIEWDSDTRARVVSGGVHRGGGVREVEYTLEHGGGGWKVISEKLMMET